jgi:hypothetical protein
MVHYRRGWLELSSASAGLRVSWSTLTGVARISPRSAEKIESVGKTPDELSDQIASCPNDFLKTSLHFFDPLLVDTFDSRIGAAIIVYYQYIAFASLKPWFKLRAGLWIDRVTYRVDIPGFDSLAAVQQRRFKWGLRRLRGCWSVVVTDPGLSADA